jgi:ZIP family zinc transporter
MQLAVGLLLPFLGTTLGAACVFFMKGQMKPLVQKMLLGFASGVMVAASVWSLLIPAMDMSEEMGKYAFIPAAAGFLLGILFLLGMDRAVPHLHMGAECAEGPKCSLKKTCLSLP